MPHIASFLQQIGANAGFLRHIYIDFPTIFALEDMDTSAPVLRREYVQVFQLIKETCPGLRTVEILYHPYSATDAAMNEDMMEALEDDIFNDMDSLENIVVGFEDALDEDIMARCESDAHTGDARWGMVHRGQILGRLLPQEGMCRNQGV